MKALEWMTVEELHGLYRAGALSVRELVLHFWKRISAIDAGEQGLRSVLEINPDALDIADELDQRLRRGEPLPPLFGIPILLKDNINTGDKMVTSAGSVALAENFAPRDAAVVARLRSSGAVILGKANMTEFANYVSREMPSGYSSRGGQVLCPYDPTRDPSGSSSGSAVAVAAGLCTLAVGTETSGSILSPARVNGVVGLKPTRGLVSRAGIVPISNTLDTAGPMARGVRDAALLLAAMAGEDPADPATLSQPGALAPEALPPSAPDLSRLRIGVNRVREDTLDPEEAQCVRALLTWLEEACSVTELPAFDKTDRILPIMAYEFQRSINAYLSALGPGRPVRSLRDIVRYNQKHPETALRYGQDMLLAAQNEATGRLVEREYWEAMEEREQATRRLYTLFEEYRLDVILCLAPTNLAPFTGFPAITVPIGATSAGMPIGSYWIARPYGEAALLRAACGVESLLALEMRPELPQQSQ